MKKISDHFLLFLFFFSTTIYSSPNSYIFPNIDIPSYSNYGTLGLIQLPNARFHEEGTIAFSWSHMQPYLRGSVLAYPFDWFEASFQYTDVNNYLYSPFKEFSGGQSYKDKGFDAKFRILKESTWRPAVALGFRDLGGTGLFSSEFIVATKRIRNIDLSIGAGWGILSDNRYSNPLTRLNNSFSTRDYRSQETEGGEFNVDSFFSGESVGLFGGVEYFIPKRKGLRFKLEYDSTNYNIESYLPVLQESKYNFSFIYPVSKRLQLKLGYVRGNTLNFGFSYAANFSGRDPIVKKNDPSPIIENAEIYKKLSTNNDEFLYKAALKVLQDNKLYLQSADINDDGGFEMTYTQSKYQSYTRSSGRVISILDQISPDKIKYFDVINQNADMPMYGIRVHRDDYQRYKSDNFFNPLLTSSEIYSPERNIEKTHKFDPQAKLPAHFFHVSPSIRSQIGGPDGFYFGDVSIAFHSELLIQENFSLLTIANVGIYDNYGPLKLASDSVLPRVRTDIVKYLKNSKDFRIERLQMNYFNKLSENLYFKLSGGFLEYMFAAAGGEILWRPFYKNYGIGAEIWQAKQRSYDMLFKLSDYDIVTGHINLYFVEPKSRVLVNIKGGRFLAGDSGINLNLSRRFKSGLQLGVFASKTDISAAEFGEGSFDKGFYFHIPIESFFSNYAKGLTSWGLRPLTRDGAQYLTHGHHLWGISDQANHFNISSDWDDIYD